MTKSNSWQSASQGFPVNIAGRRLNPALRTREGMSADFLSSQAACLAYFRATTCSAAGKLAPVLLEKGHAMI